MPPALEGLSQKLGTLAGERLAESPRLDKWQILLKSVVDILRKRERGLWLYLFPSVALELNSSMLTLPCKSATRLEGWLGLASL